MDVLMSNLPHLQSVSVMLLLYAARAGGFLAYHIETNSLFDHEIRYTLRRSRIVPDGRRPTETNGMQGEEKK